MKVNPIVDSLQGEHLVGVQPTMSPDADAQWHRRLHLYTGRTLSDTALTAEQEGRAGRLATWGQTFSPGVVSGLEVTVDSESPIFAEDPATGPLDGAAVVSLKPTARPLAGLPQPLFRPATPSVKNVATVGRPRLSKVPTSFFVIAPGFGITANGEDVAVPNLLRLEAMSIPVYAPADFLDHAAAVLSEATPRPEPGRVEEAISSTEEAGLPAAPSSQALSTRRAGLPIGDLTDPRVGLHRVGVLVLQPISAELVAQYDPTDPCEQDPSNYAFEDWQKADGCRLLFYTWPQDWIPLLAPDNRWRNRLAYAIFNAERRNQPDELLPWEEIGVPIALVGFDSNWNIAFVDRNSVVREGGRRKRRSMFVASSGNSYLWQARLKQFAEQITETDSDEKSVDNLAAQFRYLPPIGLLPKRAVELIIGQDAQVSRVGRSKFFPANYRVEVTPVPLEQLDVVMKAGASLAPFDTDTTDRVQVYAPVPEVWFERNLLKVEKVAPAFKIEIDRLNAAIAENLQRRKNVRRKHTLISRAITGEDPRYRESDPPTDAPIDPAEDSFGTTSTDPPEVTTSKQLKQQLEGNPALSADDKAKLALGLEPFIAFLEATVDRASDRVDFGFLRVQTNIYRTRQLMLGNIAATRLATSPVLASIAQGESAVATKNDIETFLLKAKKEKPPAPPPPASSTPVASIGTRSSVEKFVAGGTLDKTSLESRMLSNFAEARLQDSTTMQFMVPQEILAPASMTAIMTQASGRISAEMIAATHTQFQIEQKTPIIGQAFVPRTVTIADRIEDPKAPESKNYSAAAKFEIITSLNQTGINMDDLLIPDVLVLEGPAEDQHPKINPTTHLAVRVTLPFRDIKNQLDKRILDDPTDAQLDEAKIFSIGVELLEHTISFLRAVEGRIQAYKQIIELCRATLNATQALRSRVEQRLAEFEHALAEDRHDLLVTEALLDEETDRVKKINERRDQVVRDHVRFLAYQRPRLVDLNAAIPSRTLDPAITESPIPACLGHDVTLPAELRKTISLFRESPIKWFPNLQALLDRLDRIELLHETMAAAKERALVHLDTNSKSTPAPAAVTGAGLAVQQTFVAHQEVVTQYRMQASQYDLSMLANQSWRFARDQAKEIVSLGDVIEARHGRADVAQQATRELENISRIAGCLFTNFGEVAPALRLQWAEAFSQFDTPVNLRNLAVLPRWHDVEFLERREMQTYVDWLFQQVNPLEPNAVSLVSDLVRICLLLASHAPVNQIIAGKVPRPTLVKVGGSVELAVDHTKIRVGMSVLMYSSTNEVAARGVVEDISTGKATARVVTAVTNNLDEDARVQFTESRALDINPLTKARLFK